MTGMDRQSYRGDRDRVAVDKPSMDVRAIMVNGPSKEMIDQAEAYGRYLARLGLTTAQIRNLFGTVRQIEMTWQLDAQPAEIAKAKRQLIMLKPKLAYQAKREQSKSRGVQDLADVLSPAIDLVGDDRQRFQNFVDFFEAILAYHTAAGGSN
jgi:CRISPR-associated protein Csm2